MIRYISSFSVKTLHSMVNCGLLRMLVLSRPDADIVVEAPASSAGAFARVLEDTGKKALIRRLWVNSWPGKPATLLRYLQSVFHNAAALCRSSKGDTLIYNYNNVFSLALLNFLSRCILRQRHIIIVCHGEMENLANSGHTKAYKRLMSWLTRRFFTATPSGKLSADINFIVLGDVILSQLKSYLPGYMLERFHSVDHPVSVPAAACKAAHRDGKIRLGTVGILNRYKGADTYLRLLDSFGGDYGPLEFCAVGQIQSDLDGFRARGIRLAANPREALPDDEFNDMVSELDYILLFYPADNYRLIASGALLDTLRFRKPVIAISTAYFRYFFEKFGAVGYLCDSADDMGSLIRRLDDMQPSAFDFDAALHKLTPESLAPRFGEILTVCGVRR